MRGDKSRGIIIYGPIGSGKTLTCLRLAEKLRERSLKVLGLISPRVYEGERLIGYDLLRVSTGEHIPLCRIPERAGDDWVSYGGLHYIFSQEALNWGNHILEEEAEELKGEAVIFIDEFGRLEAGGRGLYRGAMKVAERLRGGGAAVYSCRDNLVERVEGMLRGRAIYIYRRRPGELGEILRDLGLNP